MKHPWVIRQASIQDCRIIADFNTAMALETENKHLDRNVILNGVQRLMHHPEMGFYTVGENDSGVCGSLMITFEWTDWRNGLFWWIQSVYVAPVERRKGLFKAMNEHVIQSAHNNPDVRGIRLYVEKNNHTACRTYLSSGMHETNYRLYEIEFKER
jgi:ribosomal protein S18 acetylase RimI-like enzyme